MEEITQEQALEYQQVAGLLALDIDMAWKMAQGDPEDTKMLFWIIKDLKEKRDKAISNPEVRQKRYQASSLVFFVACKSPEEGETSE
jgi:hypothetical protein